MARPQPYWRHSKIDKIWAPISEAGHHIHSQRLSKHLRWKPASIPQQKVRNKTWGKESVQSSSTTSSCSVGVFLRYLDADFSAAGSFEGPREGWIFKLDHRGGLAGFGILVGGWSTEKTAPRPLVGKPNLGWLAGLPWDCSIFFCGFGLSHSTQNSILFEVFDPFFWNSLLVHPF